MEIIRREATLFVHSTCSEDYPALKDVLSKDKKYPVLKKVEFKKLDEPLKEFITHRFFELFNLAVEEWRIHGTIQENKNPDITCQLCGHKPVIWLSYLKNIKTEEELIVGSTCIDEYKQLKGIDGESYEDIRAKNLRIQNEKVINERSPNFFKDCDEFSKLEKTSILMRTDLSKRKDTLKAELNKRQKLLSSTKKLSESQISNIINTHNKIKEINKDYNEYLAFCITDDYGITENISNWLYTDYDYDFIRHLQDVGKIDLYSLALIKEPKFMKKMILKLRPLIEENDFVMGNVFTNTTFTLAYKSNAIMLNVNSNEFIRRYRNYIFTETFEKIDIDFIIRNSKISSPNSLRKSLTYIYTKEFNQFYKEYYKDVDINELAIANLKNNKVYVVNYEQIINKFIKNIIRNEKIDFKQVLDYFEEKSEIFSTKDDYQEHIRNMNK